MERKKRTITVKETATFLSLKLKPEEMRRDWCAECAAEVTWIELPLVIELLNFSELKENCVVHFSEGRICSRSLITYLNDLKKEKGHETP
jgi:hypothetical protein